MRVVSVLPSATEMVCALGHAAELVGRSAECDFPAEVRSRPVVMWPRAWDADSPSAEIDARVSATRSQGQSLYRLDVPRLAELRPDVLLTQDLCGVCSVTGTEVQAACAEAGVRPEVVSLTPRTLEDVWANVEEVGAALADRPRGAALSATLRRRTAPVGSGRGCRVAVLEWLDPPILAGLWVPDIIARAGGIAVAGRPGEPGVRTTWTGVADLHPDLVILSPCSFGVERTQRELGAPAVRGGMRRLANVTSATFLADEAYFSRPGPRLADGVELVRHLIEREPWAAPMPVVPLAVEEVGA